MGMTYPSNPRVSVTSITDAGQAELLMEFQRLMAKMVRSDLLLAETADAIVRRLNQARRRYEELRLGLRQNLLELLTALDKGELRQGEHVAHQPEGLLAVNLEAAAPALSRIRCSTVTKSELRRHLLFGQEMFPNIILDYGDRYYFSSRTDRRRAVLLDIAQARAHVGLREPCPNPPSQPAFP